MKKAISLCLIISMLTISLCRCSVYLHNPMPSEYEACKIIGHTQEEIIDLYGEPYITLERSYAPNKVAFLYKTDVLNMFLDTYREFLYIGFNEETGLADTMIHPWTDNDIR